MAVSILPGCHPTRRGSQISHEESPHLQRVGKQQSAPMILHPMDSVFQQDQRRRRGSGRTTASGHHHHSNEGDHQIRSLPNQQTEEWQSQFFKTKLCPYHVEGRCINGDHCRFAHSPGEIRPLPDLHRTKLCESYVRKEQCTDSNCPFAHNPSELRTSSHSFYKVTLCNFYKKGRCWNGAHCRFAHGVAELQVPPSPSTSHVQNQPRNDSKQKIIKSDDDSNAQSTTTRATQQPMVFTNTVVSGRKKTNASQQHQQSNDFVFTLEQRHESNTSHTLQSNSEGEGHQDDFQASAPASHRSSQFSPMIQQIHPQWGCHTANLFSLIPPLPRVPPIHCPSNYSQYQGCSSTRTTTPTSAAETAATLTERSERPTMTAQQIRRPSLGVRRSPPPPAIEELEQNHPVHGKSVHEKNTPTPPAFLSIMVDGIQDSTSDLYHHQFIPPQVPSPKLSSFPSRFSNFQHHRDISHEQGESDSGLFSNTPYSIATPSGTSSFSQGVAHSSSSQASSDFPNTAMLTSKSVQSPSGYSPAKNADTNSSFKSNLATDGNLFQPLGHNEDVQSLTNVLFTLLQQSRQPQTSKSITSTASWMAPTRASPLPVPDERTCSTSSPDDLSNSELGSRGVLRNLSPADQWAFELLKTFETIPTNLSVHDNKTNGNDSNTGSKKTKISEHLPQQTENDRFQQPSCSSINPPSKIFQFPPFHQQLMAFAAAVAASPTARSPHSKVDDNTLTNLLNLQTPQERQAQKQINLNTFHRDVWPSSENLDSNNPDSLSVLPSLSNLVSSFFIRPSEQRDRVEISNENKGAEASQGHKNSDFQSPSSSGVSPSGNQSSYTLNFDKLVGFVNDAMNEEERIASTVSTGATTTATQSPRRGMDGVNHTTGTLLRHEVSEMVVENEASVQNAHDTTPQVVNRNFPQPLHKLVPQEQVPTDKAVLTWPGYTSPLHLLANNFATGKRISSSHQKISNATTDSAFSHDLGKGLSIEYEPSIQQENSRLSFPSLRSLNGLNNYQFEASDGISTSAPSAQVSVSSPFPKHVGNFASSTLNASDSQWTPAPVTMMRRSTTPRLMTKFGHKPCDTRQTSHQTILQTSTAQDATWY